LDDHDDARSEADEDLEMVVDEDVVWLPHGSKTVRFRENFILKNTHL
jgi:hypothetical protein